MTQTAVRSLRSHKVHPVLINKSNLCTQTTVSSVSFPNASPSIHEQLRRHRHDRKTKTLFSRLQTGSPRTTSHVSPRGPHHAVHTLRIVRIAKHPCSTDLPHCQCIVTSTRVNLSLPHRRLSRHVSVHAGRVLRNNFVRRIRQVHPRLKTATKQTLNCRRIVSCLSKLYSLSSAFQSVTRGAGQLTHGRVK